jgi:hypothetical protein
MITSLLLFLLQHGDAPTTVTFGTIDTVRLPADLGAADGDVALSYVRASGEVVHRLDRANHLRVSGAAEGFRYDWSAAEAGLPEDLSAFRLEATYLHAFDAHWKGVVQLGGAFQVEEGADVVDGGAYGAGAGVLYQAGPDLTVGLALRVLTRIEESPAVVPVPYLEWRPSTAWTLRTEAREGFGLEATHRLDDAGAWALQGRLFYSERRFRLGDDGVRPEGVFEDVRVTLAAGVRWQPAHGVAVSLVAGLDLHQRFTLEDRRGRRSAEFESEPAPLLGVQVSTSF